MARKKLKSGVFSYLQTSLRFRSFFLKPLCLIIGLVVLLGFWPHSAFAKGTIKNLETFSITSSPSKEDWRFFFESNAKFRRDLWKGQEKKGLNLGSWAWEWRIAWVRSCTVDKEAYCTKVLKDGLLDDAMVVRAEAATRLGEKYKGSGNEKILALLNKAYQNPKNSRGGKPLFVQKRILYAMHAIGGKKAVPMADKLATKNPSTKSYWDKLLRL